MNTAEQSLTHHVRLILDNDEGLYNMRREIVQRAIADADVSGEASGQDVAEELQGLYEGLVGLRDDLGVPEPGMPAMEILSTALAFVDWHEMAVDYIAEQVEYDEAEGRR